ncbi:hypothetical protein E3N88_05063 [Mikania micrantha]|uniref:Cyclin-dependent kinase inhibitor n=1 Tax=Mikania micrantha TaxID=192012 RepID=A0A5N6PW76_9ASTR|nr:hypothetical protein E3N88_05063 [Mikania micrantha]
MRTRAMAVDEAAGEKRRKVGDGEFRLPTSMLIQITATEKEEDTCRSCAVRSDHAPVSCCSSNGSTEELPFTYLEYHSYSKRRTEIKAELGLPEMITAKPSAVISSSRTVPAEKLPPATELEEFFASAEKQLYKRFKHQMSTGNIPCGSAGVKINILPDEDNDCMDDVVSS